MAMATDAEVDEFVTSVMGCIDGLTWWEARGLLSYIALMHPKVLVEAMQELTKVGEDNA